MIDAITSVLFKAMSLIVRLAPLGVVPQVLTYPDAGHSFLTDGHHPVMQVLTQPVLRFGFHEPSAQDAWPKILDFFRANLAATTDVQGTGAPGQARGSAAS